MYIIPLSGLDSVKTLGTVGEPSAAVQEQADIPFRQLLKDAVENLSEVQKASEANVYDLVTGNASDLHNITIQSAMQQTAIEMTVQLASRAVSAYKEVLQMQI